MHIICLYRLGKSSINSYSTSLRPCVCVLAHDRSSSSVFRVLFVIHRSRTLKNRTGTLIVSGTTSLLSDQQVVLYHKIKWYHLTTL